MRREELCLRDIGEAAARLAKEFQTTHSQVEWSEIKEFRNIAVHQYFAVEWSIVWETATSDVPLLQKQVEQILIDEFPTIA